MKRIFSLIILGTIFLISACSKSDNSVGTPSNNGTGGSLARFTIAGDYLYTVDHSKLKVYDISIASNPVLKRTLDVGWQIETIYPFKDKLFIGSQNSMYIYDISNPEAPSFLAAASHVTACDPVVANDSTAFVTVRSGTSCQGVENQLFVYDITNIRSPFQIESLAMGNPHGLALNDDALYICDNQYGLQVINVADRMNIWKVKTITGGKFKDCIALDNQLLCMLEDGLAIYDISDRFNPVFIEKL